MAKKLWISALAVAVLAGVGVMALTEAQEKKAAEPINDKCPLSKKDIDKSATSEVTVKFCCNNCKGKFEKTPGACLSKMDKVPNEKCPLTKKDLGDASATVTVAFCCEKCKEKFDKEPGKFLKDLKDKPKEEKK
jgi:YHS domain-containing protein